jgi:hypothetical protein
MSALTLSQARAALARAEARLADDRTEDRALALRIRQRYARMVADLDEAGT